MRTVREYLAKKYKYSRGASVLARPKSVRRQASGGDRIVGWGSSIERLPDGGQALKTDKQGKKVICPQSMHL